MKQQISFYLSLLLFLLMSFSSCENDILESQESVLQVEQSTFKIPKSLAENIQQYEQLEEVLDILVSKPKIAESEISDQLHHLESTGKFPDFSYRVSIEEIQKEIGLMSDEALNIIDAAANIFINQGLTEESGKMLESYYQKSKNSIKVLSDNEKVIVVSSLEYFYFLVNSTSFREYAKLNGYDASSKDLIRWIRCAAALVSLKGAIASCAANPFACFAVVGAYAAVFQWCGPNVDLCDDPIVDPCCDVECPPGLVCFGGNCMFDPCIGVECPPGQNCHNIAGIASCKDACFMVNCPEGTWCVDGICTSHEPDSCNDDDDCEDGDCCNNGICTPCYTIDEVHI